ncbi:SMI1/KNR4 family protein [Paenibacillus sp. CAA11]|uniref:SMI1/KNR4 family protein n=1 Tax=Paenibacillus sp. CAA11 TaxID=1532905 RepID=UPI001F22E7B5|nr:SMI1/KNR4 family protein [Paenibacillus sp. CAA11]
MKEQLYRIRRKLHQAAKADPNYEAFGAKAHQYKLNAPLEPEALRRFEQIHGIILPEQYAAFLTEIGNGGAGPYYGIHPLGTKQSIDLDRVGLPSTLSPVSHTEIIEGGHSYDSYDLDSMGDEEYEAFIAERVQGLLNIGEQGCSYETMLVVTGAYRGKVVYLELDGYRSFFTYEANFLDWYERWLDETIAGYESSWFGLRRGGDDLELRQLYEAAEDENVRVEALEGMLKLRKITDETAAFLIEQLGSDSAEIERWVLQVLAKTRFDLAEPFIRQKLNRKEAGERLLALKFIKWYMPQGDRRFREELIALLPKETDENAFRFITNLLKDAEMELLPIVLPFFTHPNQEFRIHAIYSAGDSKRKADYIQDFMNALEDPEPQVQHTALQALNGLPDFRLLESFERLLQQHKTNQYYIRSNIRGLLTAYPFTTMEEIQQLPSSLVQVKGMLRKIIGP